jgi:hypothetical protein
MFQEKVEENNKTHILRTETFFFLSENRVVIEMMSENVVKPERPVLTIQHGACDLNAA